MAFPWVTGVAWLAAALGIGTLAWYYNLSAEQRAEVDARAEELARRLYDKALKSLERHEARRVYEMVKAEFN